MDTPKRASSSPKDLPTRKQRKGKARGKVGVVNLGQLMQVDGGYYCASCGKLDGGYYCASCGKVSGTLWSSVNDSTKLVHGIVGTWSVASDVQNLCSLAIEKADTCLA
ncbi:unnamed protein product [Fraxinus pennsylvanica]|uniref:Uncharacterized protein n=1 Tax=Fraxinus pennsylvanica TaxID=56036 RepID=A0AAD1ZCG2_9LAMI|nr:unnamed protein product [Fraxinus pennsylvanica]